MPLPLKRSKARLAMDTFLFNFQPHRLSAELDMKEEVKQERKRKYIIFDYQTTVDQIDKLRLVKAFKSYHHIMEPFPLWNK